MSESLAGFVMKKPPPDEAAMIQRVLERLMTVRCKFCCTDIKDNGENSPKTVTLQTQYDDTLPEDQRFTKATPWGELKVSIDNPAALAQLKVGQCYYLDLIPC